MKKALSLLLVLVMCLCLCACGKSESVKNVEALIDAVGEVTADSEAAIGVAEEAYNALAAEEKGKVENHAELVSAREDFEKLSYIGEWVFISDSSRFSIFFEENDTWKHSSGGSGSWSLSENGLMLEGDSSEWVYEELNSVPRLVCNENDTYSVLVKKEYTSFAEYEINIDNWQEYFDYKRTYVPEYNAFGDLKSFSYFHWLALKPEYAERLVCAQDEYQIAVEFSGTPNWVYGNLNQETGEFIADFLAEDTDNQHDLTGTMYDWSMSQCYLGDLYFPGEHTYDNIHPIYYESGNLGEYSDEIFGYLQERNVGRIQGSLLLYDHPVHQIMPEYENALSRLDCSDVVLSVVGSQNAVSGVVTTLLNVRAAPSSDAHVIYLYAQGEQIEIIEQKDGWGKTMYGWVMMKYIKVNE